MIDSHHQSSRQQQPSRRNDKSAGRLAAGSEVAEAKPKETEAAKFKIESLINGLERAHKHRATLRESLYRTQTEVDRLNRELADAQRETSSLRSHLQHLHSGPFRKFITTVDAAIETVVNRLSSTREDQQTTHIALVSESEFFDPAWYLSYYEDVALADVDAAYHYVVYGGFEGRDPGPNFNTKLYLDAYQDVEQAGLNALVHYHLYGKREGRAIPLPPPPPKTVAVSEPAEETADPLSFKLLQCADIDWLRHKEFEPDPGHVMLEICGIALGRIASPQTPIDEIHRITLNKTPAIGLFCAMMHIDLSSALELFVGTDALKTTTMLRGRPEHTGESGFLRLHPALSFTDVWFINDRALRLRFETESADSGTSTVLRCFQYSALDAPELILVAEEVISAPAMNLVDVELANAYLPVLMTVTTPQGDLVSTGILPFPSLCRGGVHYAELVAAGLAAGYLQDLWSYSETLLRKLLGTPADPEYFSVGRIGLDIAGATGAEKIFSPDTRAWLAAVMNIGCVAVNSAAITNPKVRDHLSSALAPPICATGILPAEPITRRERQGKLNLTLPPDAIPSLNTLVSRTLAVPTEGGAAMGSFVMAENLSLTPKWFVMVPPVHGELLSLQPITNPCPYPVLCANGQTETETGGGKPIDGHSRRPLAVGCAIPPAQTRPAC